MSSKRRIRRNACGDKVKHTTEEAAEYAARCLKRKGVTGLDVYRCKWCGGFHVGHMPKGVKNGR